MRGLIYGDVSTGDSRKLSIGFERSAPKSVRWPPRRNATPWRRKLTHSLSRSANSLQDDTEFSFGSQVERSLSSTYVVHITSRPQAVVLVMVRMLTTQARVLQTRQERQRGYELATQLPEQVAPINVIRTDDPNGIEAYWHKRFSVKRKDGEWFDPDPADIAAFRRRKSM